MQAFLVAMCAWPLVAWAPIAFSGQSLFIRDLLNLFFPYRVYAAEQIQLGSLPVWNPYIYCGQPFLANPETSLFFPGTLWFYLLPFAKGYAAYVVTLYLLAAVGMLCAARAWGLRRSGAALAAVAFTLSAYLVQRAEFLSILGEAVCLPFAALFLLRRRWTWLGITLAVQFLGGHPQISLYTGMLLGGLMLIPPSRRGGVASPPLGATLQGRPYDGHDPDRHPGVRTEYAAWAGVLLIACGLAAVQFLPFLEFVGQSQRAGGLDLAEATSVSLPVTGLRTLLSPFAMGHLEYEGRAGAFWLLSGYVGILPLAFALRAFWVGGRKARPSAILTAVVLVLALGRYAPVYLGSLNLAPFMRLVRYPAGILFLVTFLLAMASGQGITAWKAGRPEGRPLRTLMIVVTAVELAWWTRALNPTIHSAIFSRRTGMSETLRRVVGSHRFVLDSAIYPDTGVKRGETYPDAVWNRLVSDLCMVPHVRNASGYDPFVVGSSLSRDEDAQREGALGRLYAAAGARFVLTDRQFAERHVRLIREGPVRLYERLDVPETSWETPYPRRSPSLPVGIGVSMISLALLAVKGVRYTE